MDLMAIARRTGIAPRRLRYAIYHTLAPGVSRVEGGKGSVRHFTPFEAFGIALASLLLDAGLKRELVVDSVDALARRHGRETPVADIPLYRAFQTPGTARLDVGDRLYVRLRVGQAPGTRPLDTGWLRADGGAPAPAGFDPVVLLSVNVAPLRDSLRGDLS